MRVWPQQHIDIIFKTFNKFGLKWAFLGPKTHVQEKSDFWDAPKIISFLSYEEKY
jgi:hypothetical protein